MRTVWKYTLGTLGVQNVGMPEGAEILTAGDQNGVIVLWAFVNPYARMRKRVIELVSTGVGMADLCSDIKRKYITTVQVKGYYVTHVFEREEIETT